MLECHILTCPRLCARSKSLCEVIYMHCLLFICIISFNHHNIPTKVVLLLSILQIRNRERDYLAQGLINSERQNSDQNPGPRFTCAVKLTRWGISRRVKRCLTVTSCATEHFRAFPKAEAPFLPEFRWVVNGLPPGQEPFFGASNSKAAVESVIPQLDPGKRLSGVPQCYLLGYLCVDKISLPHKSLPHAQR